MYKNERGLGLLSLILIVIIIIAVVWGAIYLLKNQLQKNDLEDIKVNVSKIEAKASAVKKLYDLDKKENPLIGVKIIKEDKYVVSEGYFDISEDLQRVLGEHYSDEKGKTSQYYIWTNEDLESQGLGDIEIDSERFYIVDYSKLEVFYSKGYDGMYELTELENIE